MHIRKVASPGPTDKMSVRMDRHRLACPQPHGDAAPMTPAGGYPGPRWGYPGPRHRLQIISGCYPVYRICTYIYSVYSVTLAWLIMSSRSWLKQWGFLPHMHCTCMTIFVTVSCYKCWDLWYARCQPALVAIRDAKYTFTSVYRNVVWPCWYKLLRISLSYFFMRWHLACSALSYARNFFIFSNRAHWFSHFNE